MTQVVQALRKAAAIFAVELSEERIAAYIDVLHREAKPEALAAAIREACKQSRFLPTPAEILAVLGDSERQRAAEAWAFALRRASAGRYVDRNAGCPPAVAQAVRLLGGWDVIGLCPSDRLHWVEKRFCELYPTTEAKAHLLEAEAQQAVRRLA